jgi:hypothetical protein
VIVGAAGKVIDLAHHRKLVSSPEYRAGTLVCADLFCPIAASRAIVVASGATSSEAVGLRRTQLSAQYRDGLAGEFHPAASDAYAHDATARGGLIADELGFRKFLRPVRSKAAVG